MKTVRAYPLLGFAPDRLATARHAPVYRKLITHLTHHGPLKWLGTPRMLPMNVVRAFRRAALTNLCHLCVACAPPSPYTAVLGNVRPYLVACISRTHPACVRGHLSGHSGTGIAAIQADVGLLHGGARRALNRQRSLELPLLIPERFDLLLHLPLHASCLCFRV